MYKEINHWLYVDHLLLTYMHEAIWHYICGYESPKSAGVNHHRFFMVELSLLQSNLRGLSTVIDITTLVNVHPYNINIKHNFHEKTITCMYIYTGISAAIVIYTYDD